MRLPVQDQRIDRAADVVERGIADQCDRAGVGIDLDLADMGAEGKAAAGEGDVRHRGQRSAQLVGQIVAGDRRIRHLEQIERTVVCGEAAVIERDVLDACFGDVGDDALCFRHDIAGRVADDDARHPHRAAGMRPAASRDRIRVTGDQTHALERDAEPFGDELREARLVALATRQRADHDVDEAVQRDRDLGALARNSAGQLDIVGDADAAQLPVPARTRACASQSPTSRRARAPRPSPSCSRRRRR